MGHSRVIRKLCIFSCKLPGYIEVKSKRKIRFIYLNYGLYYYHKHDIYKHNGIEICNELEKCLLNDLFITIDNIHVAENCSKLY